MQRKDLTPICSYLFHNEPDNAHRHEIQAALDIAGMHRLSEVKTTFSDEVNKTISRVMGTDYYKNVMGLTAKKKKR